MGPDKLNGKTEEATLVGGAMLRSELLDAFSRLEEIIAEKIAQADIKATLNAPLFQKLNALDKVPFRHPGKAKLRIDEIPDMIDCRNDIVHARLTLADLRGGDAGTVFMFRNVATAPGCTGRMVRVLSAAEFRMLIAGVKKATKHLADQQIMEATPTPPASASA